MEASDLFPSLAEIEHEQANYDCYLEQLRLKRILRPSYPQISPTLESTLNGYTLAVKEREAASTFIPSEMSTNDDDWSSYWSVGMWESYGNPGHREYDRPEVVKPDILHPYFEEVREYNIQLDLYYKAKSEITRLQYILDAPIRAAKAAVYKEAARIDRNKKARERRLEAKMEKQRSLAVQATLKLRPSFKDLPVVQF